MKQKDVALIIVVCFISAIFSLFISKAIFTSPKQRQQQVEVVDKITSDFTKPDVKYFNNTSLNPTRLIQIGDDSNLKPFNGSTQPQ